MSEPEMIGIQRTEQERKDPRALPPLTQDCADAVNVLIQAKALPSDVHYAVIDDGNRLVCMMKVGLYVSSFPPDFKSGKTHIALWRETPSNPFHGLYFADPADVIAAAVNQGLKRTRK